MRPLSAMLLAGVLLGPATLAAQEPPASPQPAAPQRQRIHDRQHMFAGPGLQGMAFAPRVLLNRRERLGLTDDQAKQLETLATEMEQAREKSRADVQARQEKLKELWRAEKPDVNAMQTEARALMQARDAVQLAAIASAARAKTLLTPEQQGRVEGWADARGWAMRRFGRGPGARGQPHPGGARMRPPTQEF